MAKRRVQLEPVGIDTGNSDIKGSTSKMCTFYPHALQRITDYDERDARGNPNIFIVNGTPYAIGRQAERISVGKLAGNARYTRDYVGVLAAIMLYRIFEDDRHNLLVNMSYPPRDRDYRSDIVEAVKGKWDVTSMGVRKRFSVIEAGAFSEPSAAFRHATYAFDGIHTHGPIALRKDVTLGLDLGGFTFDVQIFEEGKPDHLSARSFTLGVMDMYEDLERQLRKDFKAEMRGTNDYSREFLQEALRTNQYPRRGGQPLPCKSQVEQSFNLVLNQMTTVIQQYYGSWFDYSALLLMNGGTASVERRFRDAIEHTGIHVSEMERENMRFSTAFGLLKIGKALLAREVF